MNKHDTTPYWVTAAIVLIIIVMGFAVYASASTSSIAITGADSIASICAKLAGTITVPPAPTPTPPPPAPAPSPTPPPPVTTGSEIRFSAYVTGYGYPDNTPPSAEISNPVIHSVANGTGTYTDPITIAVGHSIISGKDILDYAQGTKFYIPALRRYFIVEDTCGDGSSPQNGPCHTGYQGHVWIDAWVGGNTTSGSNASAVLSCEDAITNFHLVIENPASNYAVVSGPVYNGSCFKPAGDTVVVQ